MNIDNITILNDDCFEVLPTIPKNSIQLIFADIPYNLTRCHWDQEQWNLTLMWKLFMELLQPTGVIVMTATEPFNVDLIASNRDMFKYSWIWVKNQPSQVFLARSRPLKYHEMVLVFSHTKSVYNPQMISGKEYRSGGLKNPKPKDSESGCYAPHNSLKPRRTNIRHPSSVLTIRSVHNAISVKEKRVRHPTEKPVELLEYLIKTYTNPGDTVLDPCMGTGASMIACKNLNRNGIGIELDPVYFLTAFNRINI